MKKKIAAIIVLSLLIRTGNIADAHNDSYEKSMEAQRIELFLQQLKNFEKELLEEERLQKKLEEFKLESKFSIEDIKFIEEFAKELNIEENWIYRVLELESGFNSKAVNYQKGDPIDPAERVKLGRAVGLIQWTPNTAKRYNLTTEDIYHMSVLDQLKLFKKYIQNTTTRYGDINSLEETYLAVFYPSAIGRGSDFVIGSNISDRYIKACYRYNSGIDINHGNADGILTVNDIKQWIV